MTRLFISLAAGLGLVACSGTPPFNAEPGGDASSSSVYLGEDNNFLTLNNISYDPGTDTLNLNNVPFDDPNNDYQRITTEAFANGFDAYDSNPTPGSNEIQYFAVFRRSDSGNSQVAAAGTDGYVRFGFGGAGAQRLGARPNLPSTGIYSYNGEYAAVRTTRPGNPSPTDPNRTELVTGDVRLAADFGDFDNEGAVTGTITNRILYNTAGTQIGTLQGYISLANSDNADGNIDFVNGIIRDANATEFDDNGDQVGTGRWRGVFAGPGGSEIAGVLFIEGSDVREVGGIVATR